MATIQRNKMTVGKQERINIGPSQIVDRSKPITFDFEGRTITAYEGDTVASALYASRLRIFSRSFKYHRPRGLLCVSGGCPNCLMEIDGKPNVRACVEHAQQGMMVRHQNAWPSLNHDLLSVIDKLDRFLPVGFYYKTFIHPPIEWHRVEGPIRRVAGIGSIEEERRKTDRITSYEESRPKTGGFEHLYLNADIAVVGGGPAGIAAALEAGSLGAQVILVDDQTSLGGHLRYTNDNLTIDSATGEGEYSGLPAFEIALKLNEVLSKRQDVRVLNGAIAFGLYESNLLGVVQGNRMIKLRARQVIIAAGAHEYPMVFQNNDLPGVFLGRGLQRLVNLYAVKPGTNVVIVTNNDGGLSVARTLLEAQIPIVAFVDARRSVDTESSGLKRLRDANIPVLLGYTVKEAKGNKRVEEAVLIKLDEEGKPIPGSERNLPCDILCLGNGLEAETSLLNQAGCKTLYDENLKESVPVELKPSIHACGDVTGIHDLNAVLLQGKAAGLTAALSVIGDADYRIQEPKVDHAQQRLEKYTAKLRDVEKTYLEKIASTKIKPIVAITGYKDTERMKKKFVCICEDVAEKDLLQAIFEGFDSIETLKRYSTVSMGPCQGKMCSMSSISICSRETGRTIAETGRTVSRPPYQPIPMGALAGAELHPVKLTPLHYKHLELAAEIMDMGEWKRPYIYSSVEEEYKAVRERVGVIDVGTLGKLDVKGKDAPKLLDFVYTHIFSKLQIGKCRYGVICDDAGIILDDGVITRISEHHYFITASTGNIEFVEEWFKWWATALRLDVHVTNVTAGLAAINVAGPRARDLLRKLTDLDLSTAAFPFMGSALGEVAGLPCILLRIGFVGEMGWEIHVPAEYAEYLWDSVMEAGKEFDVVPFGVEAQRVLRLEKKHIIVGQDTDATTNLFEVDMGWTVKFEKDDFIGKAALQAFQKKGVKRKLVGFIMEKKSGIAHDGDQVYSEHGSKKPIGYVTSSRFSPMLDRCVGMIWVPPELAEGDAQIKIMTNGHLNDASVVLPAFYDPEGKRLKS